MSDFYTWEDLQSEYDDVRWLWHGWIPNGYVTMIAADPGAGKSMLALAVVDKVLTGGTWFDGIHKYTADQLHDVLWVECEAGEAFHIQRARKMGINLSRIRTMRQFGEMQSTPSLAGNREDVKRLGTMLQDDHVALCIIDSLSGAITGVDENAAEVGKIVQRLSEIARDTGKPIILIHHMNKTNARTRSGADTPPSIADIRGSSAVAQHCRVIWALDDPYSDPAQPRMTCIKNNLAAKPHPIRLLIHPDGYLVGDGDIQRGPSAMRSGQYRSDWDG